MPIGSNHEKSKLAIISLILSIMGIISIVFVCKRPDFLINILYYRFWGTSIAFMAIICGHLARTKIRKNKKISGNKLALTGLIIGYIYIIILIAFFTFEYYLGKAIMDGQRILYIERVIDNCNEYISENNGNLPEDLQLVFKDYETSWLISPVTKDKSKPSYKIVPKGNIADYPDKSNTVMITEVVPNKCGNKIFVYLDDRIELISDDKTTTNVYSQSMRSMQTKK